MPQGVNLLSTRQMVVILTNWGPNLIADMFTGDIYKCIFLKKIVYYLSNDHDLPRYICHHSAMMN